jgi:hypothetical protein
MTWISPGASYGALKASIVIAGTALDSFRTPGPDTAGAFSAAFESGRFFASAAATSASLAFDSSNALRDASTFCVLAYSTPRLL